MQSKNLTQESASKLFFHYLIPAICGTMVTSIYVLADSIIIGKGIGIDALAALNIVLPLFNIFFGNGLLFGVGGSVLMSIARGRGDKNAGDKYFSVALILNAVSSILYTLLLMVFMKPIVTLLGATEITMPYILNYAPYVICGFTFFSFSSFLQTFIRNDGAPKLAMVAVITGGVSNIILDIIFVYPFKMGMAGAAIASVLGSAITVVILLVHFFSKSNGLHFSIKGLGIKEASAKSFLLSKDAKGVPVANGSFFKISSDIFKNGISSFIVEIASGIVVFVFNVQILRYIGDIGVSMYGVISNTVIIVNCLCNGVNQAAQPIMSVNYGAGIKDRVDKLRKLAVTTAFIICSVIAVVGLIIPDMFTYIFLNPNEQILELSKTAIRIYFTAFFVMGINMVVIGYFQATMKPLLSMILCLSRGCVLSIIFVYILPVFMGVAGIWAAMPLAEFISLLLAVCFLKKT